MTGFNTRLLLLICLALCVSACASVPREAVELSNTVGRDLEEVHRSHRALANLFFDMVEEDVNTFIDDVYAPAYIQHFATGFNLGAKVKGIVEQAPDNLLPVMTRFVEIAVRDIEAKRSEMLGPIRAQRQVVVEQIDASHRQVQAAQAIIAGHLASVREVHDAQNEAVAKAGLKDVRESMAKKTAAISTRLKGLIEDGKKAHGDIDKIEEVLQKIKATVD